MFSLFTDVNSTLVTSLISKDLLSSSIISPGSISQTRIAGSRGGGVFLRLFLIDAAKFPPRKVLVYQQRASEPISLHGQVINF